MKLDVPEGGPRGSGCREGPVVERVSVHVLGSRRRTSAEMTMA
jgi:hypothetical protein